MKNNILLFVNGLLGELTLNELSSYSFYPPIVTFPKELQKNANIIELNKDNKFPQYGIDCKNLPMTDYAITIDFKKDFFHNIKPPFKVYHAHTSLLPLYRGYGVISEQFLRGVCVSGVSIYLENGYIDAGDIVYQEKINIAHEDTPLIFMQNCAKVISLFILQLYDGKSFPKRMQDERKSFYLARNRKKQLIIDFNSSAINVYNFIRAYSYPYSNAYFYIDDIKYYAKSAQIENWYGNFGNAGEVIAQNESQFEIACGEGSIIINC